MTSRHGSPGGNPKNRGNNQERFGFNLLRKKASNPNDVRGNEDSSSSEEDTGPAGASGSNLNLPNFKPASSSVDVSRPAFGNRMSDREQRIEDDVTATMRDHSVGETCFDSDDEDDEDDGGDRPAEQAHPVQVDEGSSSSHPHRLHFKSRPSIIAEDVNTGNDSQDKEKESGDMDDTVSTQSSESRFEQFKHMFRRRSTTQSNHSGSHGMRNMNGPDDEQEEEGGFFAKFLNVTGGGLVPAVNSATSPGADQEKDSDQNLADSIPMVDITTAAQQIVQAHSNMARKRGHFSVPGVSTNQEPHILHGSLNGEEHNDELRNHIQDSINPPATDGETMISSHPDDVYYVPAANHYDDIDDHDDLEPLMIEGSYVEPGERVRGGVLGSLLKLYQNPEDEFTKSQISLNDSSMTETPEEEDKKSNKKKYNPFTHRKSKSQVSLAEANKHGSSGHLPNFKSTRPKVKNLTKPGNRFKKKIAAEARITVHIADLLQRQRFILRLCKALMLYGAPTHRLEEYMVMTSRVLEIDGQFLYVPGCMIISFGDITTRTSEVQLVRCNQGLNLWKLHEVHTVYKQVVHDIVSLEDANIEIDRILNGKNLYPPWLSVFLYAFCASMVTPFAFGGDWINIAISFAVGLCVGTLQFIVSQKSNLYSNVFEVTASIVVSFCARALGSIPNSNICFGSVVQGSLALILPGYIILCGSLELQSRNLVAGAVRMFYAIIYSLFLGFGITLGAALFGWIYHDATNETTCAKSISPWYRFIFVPCFSIGLGLINQARWSQLPVMTAISCCGYVVTYFSGKHFSNSTEFTSSMAAFVIGILGNLYSRVWKGFAVSAMLPAIFVQVPSGIASQSSLLAGVKSANQIVNNGTSTTVVKEDVSGSMSFGITMIQVSIGISVGLFASTLFVYPFGKKRTGLFTL